MRGSAPERSCGQGVPRVNRVIQARVVLDAIVSNKTFGNATFAPACFQTIFCNFLCRFRGPFKTFEQDSHLLVSTGTANKVKADRSSFAHTCFSSCTQPPSRSLMLEQIDKFKHFFHYIWPRPLPRAGSWYLRRTLRRSFAAEPTYLDATPAGGADEHRWGVVQLVGHPTVNEDREGSDPSAPRKLLCPRA